jgi:hypothetical protein
MHLIARIVARPLIALLVFSLAYAPIAGNPAIAPARAHSTGVDMIVRAVPAVLASVIGWHVGAPLGIVGKVIGAYVGLQVGKFIGRFLANTIGGIFHDPYQYQPPLWQRLLGIAPGYNSGYGYGWTPYAPVSSNADLGALREQWIGSVSAYQESLKGGSDADKTAKRATMEAAEKAYFGAKATAK